VNQQSAGRAHFRGVLDAGLFNDPIEQRLDGLSYRRDKARLERIGVRQGLILLFLVRGDQCRPRPVELGTDGRVGGGLADNNKLPSGLYICVRSIRGYSYVAWKLFASIILIKKVETFEFAYW